jgi:hypothetical protein
MSLEGLFPNTFYHFKVFCRDTAKNSSETGDYQFSTLAPPDTEPPANVSNFEVISGDGQVELKWKNPSDSDFKGARILRSEKFFPLDPWNGALVYEGDGESVFDTGLTNNVRYYYTAFTYDRAGNFSSGAIVSAIPRKPGFPKEGGPIEILPPEIPEAPTVPPELKDALDKLTLKDFEFWQFEKKIAPIGDLVAAKPKSPLTVLLEYDKLPEVLKTIAVTLLQDDGKSFSFLLRVNKDKTAFIATLIPPDPRKYEMKIQVLDYKNQRLKKIDGELEIEKLPEAISKPFWVRHKLYIWGISLLGLLSLILFMIFSRILRRRRGRESERNQENSPNYNISESRGGKLEMPRQVRNDEKIEN